MTARFCNRCGHVGEPTTATPGSLGLEILLWLLFLLPGLLYSISRHVRRHDACAQCGSAELLPINSPAAKAKMKDFGVDAPPPPQTSAAAQGAGRALGKAVRWVVKG
jgi:hypothetical protein